MNKRERGKIGEELAVAHLIERGYRIVQRNFRHGRGEIDIVAEDGETLVFVEVKARKSAGHSQPEESITHRKRDRLQATAEGYLLVRSRESRDCRFDVIAITWEGNEPHVHHMMNVF